MLGAITVYTDDIPAHSAGVAKMFVVIIRPEYKSDKGLHEHEYMHVKQWYLTSLLFCAVIFMYCFQYAGLSIEESGLYSSFGIIAYTLMYGTIPRFRLWCEVQAYRKQLKYCAVDESARFGKFISTAYDLDITAEAATKLLRQ